MTHIRFPRNGERVVFQDGEQVRSGICNGEPFQGDAEHPEHLTHLPVHVPETNANIMVATHNIIEWPEA